MSKKVNYIRSIPDFIWLTLVAIAVFALSAIGLFSNYQNDITDLRAEYSKRSATGEIVFIGIDKKSLDKVGVWPWPRSVHADIIDKLIEMDVAEIGVDIDFSARSTPENDARLAQSLESAGGAVVLPTFVQAHSASGDTNQLSLNRPIKEFEKHSWLASVNVIPDADGIVRSFPNGIVIDGELLSSLPQVLSGQFESVSDKTQINFSVDPKTVPKISASDLLEGKVDASLLKDKTILLGASAVELRDNFAVPVHGILPGALVQILAAETLKQDIELVKLEPYIVLLLATVLLSIVFIAFTYILKLKTTIPKYCALISVAISAEVLGLYLFQTYNLVLPTVQLHAFLLTSALMLTILEMDLRHWLLIFSNIKNKNTQDVLDQVLQDNANGVLILDEEGAILNINKRAMAYLALPKPISSGLNVMPLLPSNIVNEIQDAIAQLNPQEDAQTRNGLVEVDNDLHEGKVSTLEYIITVSNLANVENGQQNSNVVVSITLSDITKKLEQERLIEYHAKYDALTGALRRNEFQVSITKRMKQVDTVKDCTVFAFSLHRFKTINVVLGRDIGDEVLKEVKKRTMGVFGGECDFARLGGDAFAIAVTGDYSKDEMAKRAERLIEVVSEPFEIGKSTLNIGLRVGGASSSMLQQKDALQLIENAEVALEEACKNNGNGFIIYEEILTSAQDHARTIENDLWQSLAKDEIQIYYQPQIDIKSGALAGLEALVRWKHPTLGFVSPAEFVDIAEANGFIDQLGEWVLNKACEDALLLPEHIAMAVNVSPIQIKRTDIASIVEATLQRTGLPASRLHIEITEAGFLEDTQEIVATLQNLRKMGICLALDDFGTGFASLGYFTKFPFNKIKLDQMFIRTLTRGSQNEAIVRSVKELATGLNLQMICEGVETLEQLELLREIDIDQAQGYLFSKPQPIAAILQMNPTAKLPSEQLKQIA